MRRLCLAVSLFLAGCGDQVDHPGPPVDSGPDAPEPTYTIEQLKDPETCSKCHAKHYREWSGSMHAYASDDPMFLAMNERGQREAGIKNFCVQCHAPMAVASLPEGTVVDSAMLKALPKSQRGVTCYFCHSTEEVTGTHNNPLRLANDGVMRGAFADAVPNEAHRSKYSELLDGKQLASAGACGACHDIVNDHGAHVERTFQEWKETVFSYPGTGSTCAQCHVEQRDRQDVVAEGPNVKGVFLRYPHDHRMAAVDRAITPFPEMEDQEIAVKQQLNYPAAIQTGLCVAYFGTETKLVVIIDNIQAGHKWPSGAAQDRQLWVELTAYAGGQEIYSSGRVPPGTDATESADPDIWLMRDCMFDENGKQTHLFWETKTTDPNMLPGPLTLDPTKKEFYQTHVTRAFPASSARIPQTPDRVTLKVWMQAFPYAVFDELTPELKTLGYNDAEILGMRGRLEPMQVTADTVEGGYDARELEWTWEKAGMTKGGVFTNNAGVIDVIPRNIPLRCVTRTNMALGVDTVPAPAHQICKP